MKDKTPSFRIYRCSVCGNIIVKLNDSGIDPQCCGRDMTELKPGEGDGNPLRHVPVWWMEGCKVHVTVGEEPHPMIDSHLIQWILIITNQGMYAKYLTPDSDSEACFKICKHENVQKVLAYCNIHGLYEAAPVVNDTPDLMEKITKNKYITLPEK